MAEEAQKPPQILMGNASVIPLHQLIKGVRMVTKLDYHFPHKLLFVILKLPY